MTEPQALDCLNAKLPREAGFSVSYWRCTNSRLNGESLRTEPLTTTGRETWAVSVCQDDYVHSTLNEDLGACVEAALAHYLSGIETKPPKLTAPSSVPTAQEKQAS